MAVDWTIPTSSVGMWTPLTSPFFCLLLTICHINSCKFFMSINSLLLVLGGLERRRWVQPKRIKGGRHDYG